MLHCIMIWFYYWDFDSSVYDIIVDCNLLHGESLFVSGISECVAGSIMRLCNYVHK
jgi:hypothetical protein